TPTMKKVRSNNSKSKRPLDKEILSLRPDIYEPILKGFTKFEYRNTFANIGSPQAKWLMDEYNLILEFVSDSIPLSNEFHLKCLAILLAEVKHELGASLRSNFLVKNIQPKLLDGIEELTRTLHFYSENALNVESISFDMRRNPLSKGHKFKSNKELESTRNPIKLKVSGLEVISFAMNAIAENRIQLEALTSIHQNSKLSKTKISAKDSVERAKCAKKFAKLFYRFLNEEANMSNSRAVHATATLLSYLNLMPDIKVSLNKKSKTKKRQYDLCRKYITQ
ncbi:MAG: hypothetical protein ACKVOK_12550, partial [Flavobacteriales bacterium]